MPPPYNFILIDDSNFDLFIYEKLIVKSGMASAVKPFNSARLALEYITEHHESIPPSVILLDLQLPGMNGFEFIEGFGRLPENVTGKMRVFMLSSTIDNNDIDKARVNPYIIDLLSKPLEIPLLQLKLDELEQDQ
jgi:response regulator RpfG family c-di-GMP phosphodiesterase